MLRCVARMEQTKASSARAGPQNGDNVPESDKKA
jgi:hypothetical protein